MSNPKAPKAPAAYRPTTSTPLRVLENHIALQTVFLLAFVVSVVGIILGLANDSAALATVGLATLAVQGLVTWRSCHNAPSLPHDTHARYEEFVTAYEQIGADLAGMPSEWLLVRRELEREHEQLCTYLFAEADVVRGLRRKLNVATPVHELTTSWLRGRMSYDEKERFTPELRRADDAAHSARQIVSYVQAQAARTRTLRPEITRHLHGAALPQWERSNLATQIGEIEENVTIDRELQERYPVLTAELAAEIDASGLRQPSPRNTH